MFLQRLSSKATQVVLFAILFSHGSQSQPSSRSSRQSDFFTIASTDTLLQLRTGFLRPGSVVIRLNDGRVLRMDVDYRCDTRKGQIFIIRGVLEKILAGDPAATLTVGYELLPVHFQDSYTLRSPDQMSGILPSTPAPAHQYVPERGGSELFGRGLHRSGSIVRGVTIGTKQDASITSGFRLQMSGNVTDDVELTAALTDEQSPLQPEGTTQALSEVDRVYMTLTGKTFGLTFGDFVYERDRLSMGAFGGVRRKFQGIEATLDNTPGLPQSWFNSIGVTAASSRGRFASHRFQGSDSRQGPYQLTGKNGEPLIIVIAGSERVSINGESMARGEVNDYTIDYSTGEITFTSRRRITNASRIAVDFEYADRQYVRNAVGGALMLGRRDSMVVASFGILQEADDPSAPLDFTFDQTMREKLRQAGPDQLAASLDGAKVVGIDTATGRGRGQYISVDTLIGGRMRSIFRFAPGDPKAVYSVAFTPVTIVPGDSIGYNRIRSGEYRFAGLGTGAYMARQHIPMPELKRYVSSSVIMNPTRGLKLTTDFSASVNDPNRQSPILDSRNNGGASQIMADFSPGELRLGSMNFGTLELSLSQRILSSSFVTPNRLDPAEYERTWDLSAIRTGAEVRREGELRYSPIPNLNASMSAGKVNRTGAESASKWKGSGVLSFQNGEHFDASMERVTRISEVLGTKSEWTRQSGSAVWPLAAGIPSLRLLSEVRRDEASTGTLSDGSFRSLEAAPAWSFPEWKGIRTSTEFLVRREDSSIAGVMSRAMTARTPTVTIDAAPGPNLSSSLVMSVRRTAFTQEFKNRGNQDATSVLVHTHTRFAFWNRSVDGDMLYDFSNERSARLERVFIRAPHGTGSYRYAGDTNGNGRADEAEFTQVRFDGDYVPVYLPGEQLIPVSDVKASVRIRWMPSRSAMTPAWLNLISGETLLRVEERSSDPVISNIYGLRVSSFLRTSATLQGSQTLSQDVHFRENDPTFSTRLRVTERRSLTQFVSSPERGYGNERSLRIRGLLMQNLSGQLDAGVVRDRLLSEPTDPRQRDLTILRGIADFSHRLGRKWEVGWNIGASSIENGIPGVIPSTLNDQSLRVVFAMPGTGQIRSEIKREEAVLSSVSRASSSTMPPFELTQGRVPGLSWLWQLALEIRLTDIVQFSSSYSGRKEGRFPVVHTLRAEARAAF